MNTSNKNENLSHTVPINRKRSKNIHNNKKSDIKNSSLVESLEDISKKNTGTMSNRPRTLDIEEVDGINNYPRIFKDNETKSKKEKSSNQFQSESIFAEQRNKIDKKKKEILKTERKTSENEVYLYHEKKLSLASSATKWEYTTYTTDIMPNNHENPVINNKNWTYSENIGIPLEIRNLIFRSDSEYDYSLCYCELNITFVLQGISTFWLFLHNEDEIFNENSAVIQISKVEENTQKVFLSLGVFINGNEYKILNRQQLINFNNKSKNNLIFIETDTINIRLILQDPGDDNIKLKAYVNNCLFENSIDADIFLPFINCGKIFIAGSGHRCTVERFDCISYAKPYFVQKFDIRSEKNPNNIQNSNDCSCCLIY